MPKISHWCPDCNNRGKLRGVYAKIPTGGKSNSWKRLMPVFYCENCKKLVLYPFKTDEMGQAIYEKYNGVVTIP